MPTDGQLTSAFDKATKQGPENLTGIEKDFYLIQDFILEWENGALSGYLNRIPDFAHIRAAAESMKRHGMVDLASILSEAVELFDGYQEPNPPTTWGAVLGQHDGTGRLRILDGRIRDLPGYGLTP